MNIEIEDIKRLSLKPDDVLMIRSKDKLSGFVKNELRKTLTSVFPDNKILIVDGGFDLSIVEKVGA